MTSDVFAAVVALAIAFGVSPYATVALLGLFSRLGWIGHLPPHLGVFENPWVITLAVMLTAIEFAATLVPGLASAWEAVHTMIRPPAAAAMAVAVAWGGSPAFVMFTGLLAGSLAFGTSLTKLGARLAIDTSPEPVSNGAANIGELTFVALVVFLSAAHPALVAGVAFAMVAMTALFVRAVWGLIWKSVARSRRPGVRSIRS